jgi:hypothetical protein
LKIWLLATDDSTNIPEDLQEAANVLLPQSVGFFSVAHRVRLGLELLGVETSADLGSEDRAKVMYLVR